jgi:hypothetical protein
MDATLPWSVQMSIAGKHDEPEAVWAEYRRRRTLAWAVPLLLLTGAFALSLSKLYSGPWPFMVPVIIFTALYFRFQLWPCPRCGKPFTETKRDLTFSRCCQNCGLKLWTDAGDVDAYRKRRHDIDCMLNKQDR